MIDMLFYQFRISEMEMNKAKNMVVHQKEIMSRPPKSWIKKEKGLFFQAGFCQDKLM